MTHPVIQVIHCDEHDAGAVALKSRTWKLLFLRGHIGSETDKRHEREHKLEIHFRAFYFAWILNCIASEHKLIDFG